MSTIPTILLVEDEDSAVFFIEHTLTKLAFPHLLRVAHDGREAQDYLAGRDQFADRGKFPIPRLIILDLKMPRVTGFEVLAWIRSIPELRRLIVIVMTSSADERDIDRAYDLGANAFIVKPSGIEELTDILRALQQFWLVHSHAPRIQEPPVNS